MRMLFFFYFCKKNSIIIQISLIHPPFHQNYPQTLIPSTKKKKSLHIQKEGGKI